MSALVLDASVAVAWLFDDEDEPRRMRVAIKSCLRRNGVGGSAVEALAAEIIDLVRTRTEP